MPADNRPTPDSPKRAKKSPKQRHRSKTQTQQRANTAAPARRAEANSQRYGVRAELDERHEKGAFVLWFKERFRETPGWMASAFVHAIVLVVLMLITIAPNITDTIAVITAEFNRDEPIEEPMPDTPPVEFETPDVTELSETLNEVDTPIDEPMEPAELDEPLAQLSIELKDVGLPAADISNPLKVYGNSKGNQPIGERRTRGRKRALLDGGGNEASEAAVAKGLKWLAAHQNPNGSWSFNHGLCPKHRGPVNQPGKNASLTGATAMALLPFLGAGQTHLEGEYKEVVNRGLYFLCGAMKYKPTQGGNLMGDGGRLYAQGLAAIVLCEAYALSQDKQLRTYAQSSLDFIIYAQDKTGGGWRYTPHSAGDTSVVGWQIMALKSGHLAYLNVPKNTIAGAAHFLDSVQENDSYGAYYGYMRPGKKASTTAIGLLCRMYLGWKMGNPGLIEGVNYLARTGPSKSDMYYNYYATQVLHHWGGDLESPQEQRDKWIAWNNVMRDQLVNSQIDNGEFFAEKGSWTPVGRNHKTDHGGRLYYTSLSVMTLEVYYRYMPIYRKQGVEQDF